MGKTLLVVDDHADARDSLEILLRLVGYDVVTAANGKEALDLLGSGLAPDLILLDMLMPVLDGWHFLERLQRDAPQPRAPIIVTTATILTPEWARDHGCQGFLRKPINPDDLFAEVRRCLGEA